MLSIAYDEYLDRVLGGWIGKSLGGAVGARFEGTKEWIEIDRDKMLPDELPPNDDLDLQILWLKVLEEKGPALTSDDLAAAWLEGCWYPFNEYGSFRRNWRLGIHPPYSGSFNNEFWETGEGCPIRSEIWGYAFPGAPDLAAKYAYKDGVLDHTGQTVAAEQMFAAMAAMAFFIPDVRRLTEMFIHYLPAGSTIERLTRSAFASYDQGLSLREARERIMALAGHPEACDSQTNVPFTFLGLLYGQNDLVETLLAALRCGYDTDCTLATSGAFIGQMLGARRIPASLREGIGDELVMGIEYRRREMTLSALARDTARVGILLGRALGTGVGIAGAPAVEPFPAAAQVPANSLRVDYAGEPAAAPGETVGVTVSVDGRIGGPGARLELEVPAGWEALPSSALVSEATRTVPVVLRARETAESWPQRHLMQCQFGDGGTTLARYEFGVAGSALWGFLGVYFDPQPDEELPRDRRARHHFVRLDRDYLPEPEVDVAALIGRWTRILGRPAVLSAPTYRLDLTQLVGLRGEYCVYLSRTVLCPDDRDVFFVVGNNDAYRIYLNGERVAEVEEYTWWTPFNGVYRVHLRQGENRMLLKLLKRGERLDFSVGIRQVDPRGHNRADWVVDLADWNPLPFVCHLTSGKLTSTFSCPTKSITSGDDSHHCRGGTPQNAS